MWSSSKYPGQKNPEEFFFNLPPKQTGHLSGTPSTNASAILSSKSFLDPPTKQSLFLSFSLSWSMVQPERCFIWSSVRASSGFFFATRFTFDGEEAERVTFFVTLSVFFSFFSFAFFSTNLAVDFETALVEVLFAAFVVLMALLFEGDGGVALAGFVVDFLASFFARRSDFFGKTSSDCFLVLVFVSFFGTAEVVSSFFLVFLLGSSPVLIQNWSLLEFFLAFREVSFRTSWVTQ
eukprot:TRINITY_DN340_c0_g1_i2.p1 TRINITY_DN340_c0_g1~~TRINITY_DN340_c0_g1_i2.p1  ORF type:complete len:235 (-),score=51.61 TRINITY_DN340_c0_g1_i2:181-885(-)